MTAILPAFLYGNLREIVPGRCNCGWCVVPGWEAWHCARCGTQIPWEPRLDPIICDDCEVAVEASYSEPETSPGRAVADIETGGRL